jgi:3-oxoacyl-[acyl-carrier-protein] synthase-3
VSAAGATVGLAGLGTALPATVRRADDPSFGARQQGDEALFFGCREHRTLAPGESLAALTVSAARAALADAGIGPGEVDRLYGHLSPSELIAPNELYRVHRELGLPTAMAVVPIQAEYDCFLLALEHAWEAVRGGRVGRALVAVGSGISRVADHAQAYAPTVGDAAAAAVVARSDRLVILDSASETSSRVYGAITVQPRPDAGAHRPILFRFEPGRTEEVVEATVNEPPRLVRRLLDRNGLAGSDVTLITHQNTPRVMAQWTARIAPRAHLDTLADLGNMLFASVPVTLERHRRALTTEHLVLLAVGMSGNATAMLLRV